MKQAGYSKRSRGRSFEGHRQPQRNPNGDSFENNSRGNPQQSVEKFLSLARDAASSGDPVAAENYYQYADHYYRIAAANRVQRVHEKPSDHREKPHFPSKDAKGETHSSFQHSHQRHSETPPEQSSQIKESEQKEPTASTQTPKKHLNHKATKPVSSIDSIPEALPPSSAPRKNGGPKGKKTSSDETASEALPLHK